MYDEGREALNKLISIFSSCITNETHSASADVQRLTDATNNLKANLTKNFQDTLQCFKNPFTAVSCIPNVSILINCYILILKNILFIIIYKYFYNNTKLSI